MVPEPQSANDHDAATSQVAMSVLIAIAQVFGAYRDKSVVVGGSVPWLQPSPEDMIHAGARPIDLSRDAEASSGREYKTRVAARIGAGYAQTENTSAFQLARQVQTPDGGPSVDIIVDCLTPKDAVIIKNNPPLRSALAVNRRQRVTPRRFTRQAPLMGSRDCSELRQLRGQPDGAGAGGHPAAPAVSDQRARWRALLQRDVMPITTIADRLSSAGEIPACHSSLRI